MRFLRLVLFVFCVSLAGCAGSDQAATGSGGVGVNVVWKAASLSSGKRVAKAPSGVETVRVTITGEWMAGGAVKKEFPAINGGGMIDGITAGVNRTITVQGLDAGGKVIAEGAKGGVTVYAGNPDPVRDVYTVEATLLSVTQTVTTIPFDESLLSSQLVVYDATSSVVVPLDGATSSADGKTIVPFDFSPGGHVVKYRGLNGLWSITPGSSTAPAILNMVFPGNVITFSITLNTSTSNAWSASYSAISSLGTSTRNDVSISVYSSKDTPVVSVADTQFSGLVAGHSIVVYDSVSAFSVPVKRTGPSINYVSDFSFAAAGNVVTFMNAPPPDGETVTGVWTLLPADSVNPNPRIKLIFDNDIVTIEVLAKNANSNTWQVNVSTAATGALTPVGSMYISFFN